MIFVHFSANSTRLETGSALKSFGPGFSTDLSTGIVENASPSALILKVALDTPLRRTFDYRGPAPGLAERATSIEPGVRVRVPFGRSMRVGVVVGIADTSALAPAKLKAVERILDDRPLFDPVTFELLRWAAEYYRHPIGEVFAAALPAGLREGRPAAATAAQLWALTEAGAAQLADPSNRRGPRRRALLAHLAVHGPRSDAELAPQFAPSLLRAVRDCGWIRVTEAATAPPSGQEAPLGPSAPLVRSPPIELGEAQGRAVAAIQAAEGRYRAFLLYGVTGSGKTEVYLRAIATAIAGGGQALVLVPEISLTPQLVERFRRRFDTEPAILHSGLADRERRDAWQRARNGEARVIIGTRSAVFASIANLAMIVVDEEHDPSYKQQEGFRYSARDLAVLRAQRARVPIVLGSATPSLESLENAARGRYDRLDLPERAGMARPARMTVIDLRRHGVEQGFSQPALAAMQTHLGAGGQVLVFLNRRGYAPSLYCTACGWVANCRHCDARLTLHRREGALRCHHCGAQRRTIVACESCSQPLRPVGQGTERVEETLERLFPGATQARLDRDTAAARGAVESVLARVHSGEARILIGTQMLTKGHHFPDVSLVVILDADQGLFATDYRAAERLAQTIVQVAGRAGRAERAGEVLIQSNYPEHPLLTLLTAEGYEAFASRALAERREAHWPPFSRLALLRAESRDTASLDRFLRAIAERGRAEAARGPAHPAPRILGPASALVARRADRFRAHLLIEADDRAALQRFLAAWLPLVESTKAPSGLRWSIDVDPLEVD
ncbi:MAG: primosomal protein N' [Gammaproteobacteria bacterium]|nr:primosomal protein N' [Gammaproteobacteria bacterium]